MSRFNRSLTRTGIAGLAVGVASVVAASTAQPAGASAPPATAAATHSATQPVHPLVTGQTPMCLVGAALFYPMFLGGVLFTNPASLPSAAPGYWAGGAPGDHAGAHGKDSHGWLPACGLAQ